MHCENSIDEAMIPFEGCNSLKQYMPAKPVKQGIKMSQMVTSVSFKCTLADPVVSRMALERGWYWISLVISRGHYHLYFDNYFSSVSLSPDHNGLYV